MLKRILAKDVTSVCDVKDITEGGYVLINGDMVGIYKVEPINMVSIDKEIKKKIYDAYISTVRGLPNTFEILVTKRKDSLKPEIEIYKKKLLEVENYGLKIAMKKYIDYLEELESDNEMYRSSHYLISRVNEGSKDVEHLFSNLKEFGLNVTKITSKKELEEIFRRAITW